MNKNGDRSVTKEEKAFNWHKYGEIRAWIAHFIALIAIIVSVIALTLELK